MICKNCHAETYTKDERHPNEAACTLAWRTLLSHTMVPIMFAQKAIAKCRKRRHIGAPVLAGKDLCTRCLAAGYKAYEIIERMVGFFSSSAIEAEKERNGGKQRPDQGNGTSPKRTLSTDAETSGGGRKPR